MTAAAPTQTLTERFAFAIELVLRGLSLSLPRRSEVAPLALATWNRLKRLVARFSALAAAVEAGRCAAAPCIRAPERKPRPFAQQSEAPAQVAKLPWPQAYGWLLALAPELNTRIGRAQIETLIADPALRALLAQAPQAGRILRPLCHMLRIELPECLRLPPRQRRTPRPAAEAAPGKPARVARPPLPSKPGWLRWPKSPPLPGLERTPTDQPPERTATGPPGD